MSATAPANRMQDPPPGPQVRLAYLLSSYPAISHTFFLNEIAELTRLGFSIDVASINKPVWPPNQAGDAETRALAATFYVKAMGPLRVLLTLFKVMLTRPRVVFRGLRAALQLDRWNLPASSYSLFYLAEALIVGDWLRRHRHSHLHIHFGGPVSTVGMLAAVAWQFSYSLMLHGPEEFYDVDKFHLSRKMERAAFVLCISDYCRSQVMKVSDPATWARLHVVRLGVDLQLFAPAAQRGPGSGVEIICVGRLVPAKGQLILLQAFSLLRDRGHNLRLRLIGDGPDRTRIEAFITRNKLDSMVILDGALNHQATRTKLAGADIFVLASFAEGLPIALMEAMAMEIPCVSTFVAGIPELIRDQQEGLLVPPSSAEALSIALERLLSDQELRRALAQAGRRRVEQSYSLQQNVRTLAEVLRTQIPATPKD